MDREADTWSVGELAARAGITVRTLHHYDRVGLLVASERTDIGHRRYTAQDVSRLYRIVALRSLGLSLDEIAAVFDGDEFDADGLRDVLAAHAADLQAQQQRLVAVRRRVERLLEAINDHDNRTGDLPTSILSLLEEMSVQDNNTLNLIKTRRLGSARDAATAERALVDGNRELIETITTGYLSSGLDRDRLLEAAERGFMAALDTFDVTKAYKLATFATWWIRQALTVEIKTAIEEGTTVHDRHGNPISLSQP